MSDAQVAQAALVILVAFAFLVAAPYWIANLVRAHRNRAVDLARNEQVQGEQYTARTPAGTAVITRVLHPDLGERYEIETMFRGARDPSLYYVPPSLPVVVRRLTTLSNEWLAREVDR